MTTNKLAALFFAAFFSISTTRAQSDVSASQKIQRDLTQQSSNKGVFKNLGPQLGATMIQGSLFAQHPDGRILLYTVVRGEPAHLLGYDAANGQLLLDVPLPGADGAWDLTQSTDGTIYVPGASGILFAHQPGSKTVQNLGMALSTETYVWNVVAGKNGEVFGATYPSCRVFRYHPKEGFSDVGKGPLVTGENYVRSLAYHRKTDRIFAGIGSHAALIELNPRTAKKTQLLPDSLWSKEFVYTLDLLEKTPTGDFLLVHITTGGNTMLYSLNKKQWGRTIQQMDRKAVLQVPGEMKWWFTQNRNLYEGIGFEAVEEASNGNAKNVLMAKNIGTANAMTYTRNKELWVLTTGGNLFKFQGPKKIDSIRLNIPAQPIPIQSMLYDQQGRIWTGGYLAGGNATYHVQEEIHNALPGLDQTEGMAVWEDELYMGIYPKGKFYVHRLTAPFSVKNGNPRFLGQFEGQSRSFAIQPMPIWQSVFFGMVPEYGQLGGSLVQYRRDIDSLIEHKNPIPHQSIVALLPLGKKLLGGTSISGGLGATPQAKEAVLFIWNPATNTVEDTLVPVPGAMAITSLLKGPDGFVWGIADGKLFRYDSQDNKIESVEALFPMEKKPTHIWRSAFLLLHPNGKVYGTDQGKFFEISAYSRTMKILAEQASLLTMDGSGRLYFKRGTELWQYTPE